jgi:hypothetical protein
MVSPYLPPKPGPERTSPAVRRLSRSTAAVALGVAFIGGVSLGAITNSINGYISPEYFRGVMGWHTRHIWAAAVGQGAVEGLIYAIFSTALLIGLTLTLTRCELTTRNLVRLQLSAFFVVSILWVAGGLTAVVVARYFPHKCAPRYFGYSTVWPEAGYYAWVRGSIWGAVSKTLLSETHSATKLCGEPTRTDPQHLNRNGIGSSQSTSTSAFGCTTATGNANGANCGKCPQAAQFPMPQLCCCMACGSPLLVGLLAEAMSLPKLATGLVSLWRSLIESPIGKVHNGAMFQQSPFPHRNSQGNSNHKSHVDHRRPANNPVHRSRESGSFEVGASTVAARLTRSFGIH